MKKICKNCKHSETYKGYKTYEESEDSPNIVVTRKCDFIYDEEQILPRLNEEEGHTGVVAVDVNDDFGCILFEK